MDAPISRPALGSWPIPIRRANTRRPSTKRRRWSMPSPGRAMNKILLIDNYDSFTYNLVQYFGVLGCDVVVRRNDEITVADAGAISPERICISPGPGRPEGAG